MNLATLLQMSAEAFGDRIAISHDGQDLSYAQWYEAAQRAAKIFADSGCEYVAALDVYTPALPIALYGAAMAGLPYVPLNYRLTDQELDALLARIEPAYLISSGERLERYRHRDTGKAADSGDFLRMVLQGEVPEVDMPMDPELLAVQLFTSGTTGTPKAALLRHKNITSYILSSVDFASAGEDEAALVSVPPYHIAGISAVISAVFAVRRVVLLPSFSPEAWLQQAAEEKVSNAFVVPTMLVRIVEKLEAEGVSEVELPNLRAIAYGGGKMPQSVIKRALELFPNVAFTNAYGLTETSSTITVLGPDEHRAALASDDPAVRKRLTSVGVALPGVELQIRDSEGRELPANTPGEIYVRGEQVAGEYAEKGSMLDADGWFPTKDSGYLDDEAYLFLDGRSDDVIVRGGENISPGEVEDVLVTHPFVVDSAVVGVPSEQWGEAVAAVVQLNNGADVSVEELQQLVRDSLRSSRIPERIEFVSELPYNEMGKLLRRQVRELLAQ